MSISVISANVRGLGNKEKRRAIFEFYRKRADIICLQETHSTKDCEMIWRNEWGADVIYSHHTSESAGVCILLPRKKPYCFKKFRSDCEGRIIICEIQICETPIVICNIYAPNKDEPRFFVRVLEMLQEFAENKIIIGDFNMVMDVKLDRKDSDLNHKNSLEILKNANDEFLLTDVWRDRNPLKKRFSWFKPGARGTIASRIDFALMEQGVANKVSNVTYTTGILSDHSAYYVAFDFISESRGAGYWKFNTSHLKIPEFVQTMTEKIQHSINGSLGQDIKTRWEILKKDFVKYAKQFARNRASENQLIIAQLSEKVVEMEDRLSEQENQDDYLSQLLQNTKEELHDLTYQNIRGVMFRTKSQWHNYAEKSSAYFYNLEKSKYNAKTCHALFDSKGNIVKSTKSILELQKQFYGELFDSDRNVHFDLKNPTEIKVPEHIRLWQNQPITYEEVSKAISQMSNQKTPGVDGIPVEFYKFFWKEIKDIFMELVADISSNGHMHKSAMMGIINLIPKANRDTRVLANLRPITLLCADFKIFEKIIANRMIPAMEHIIAEDQRGFMQNRRISVNIRKILDLIQKADEEDLEAFILSVDFMKCFDKIEIPAIQGALEYFGFGQEITKWLNITYTGFQAKIQNNGYFSQPISIKRGVHQGGPASSFYFLICAEILAIQLRQSRDLGHIKGIPVNDIINLLGQYADDADLYLLNDQNSLHTVFNIITEFGKHTGFTINYDKTTIYRIGALKHSMAKLYTQQQIAWTNEPINILGVVVTNQKEDLAKLNYEPLVVKTKNILNSWTKRGLSLIGKVNVINTLIGSLFVHKMMVLPSISDKVVNDIEKCMINFLWGKSKPKIPIRVLQKSKKCGGLKLVNLRKRDNALKTTWIKILETESSMRNIAYSNLIPEMQEMIWDCNLNSTDIKQMFDKRLFWVQVLMAWSLINYSTKQCNQIIWLNSDIRIGGKPVIWKKALAKGLIWISQLFANGTMDIPSLMRKYNLTWLECHSLRAAISQEQQNFAENEHQSTYQWALSANNLSSRVYEIMCYDNSNASVKRDKWQEDLNKTIEISEFHHYFADIHYVTNVPKFRSFQYRLLHRAIITNVHLFYYGIVENKQCTFCQDEQETYLHLFIYCKKVKDLWLKVEELMDTFSDEQIDFKEDKIICNKLVDNPNNIKNFICLIVKHYVYQKRCLKQPLVYNELKAKIYEIKAMEKTLCSFK